MVHCVPFPAHFKPKEDCIPNAKHQFFNFRGKIPNQKEASVVTLIMIITEEVSCFIHRNTINTRGVQEIRGKVLSVLYC
jgi:hypothetical protein